MERYDDGSPFARSASYARAVRRGTFVAVSATAATDSAGAALYPGDAYGQAREALERALAAARELGASREDVVRTRVYLGPGCAWEDVMRAHGELFAGAEPANTTVVVADFIPRGVLVEIELDAVLPGTG